MVGGWEEAFLLFLLFFWDTNVTNVFGVFELNDSRGRRGEGESFSLPVKCLASLEVFD